MLNRRQNKVHTLFCAAEKNTHFQSNLIEPFMMVFWQSHILLILLLAFSGLSLIRSDCGNDADRLNGFCDLRRSDHNINDRDLSRQYRHFERKGESNRFKLYNFFAFFMDFCVFFIIFRFVYFSPFIVAFFIIFCSVFHHFWLCRYFIFFLAFSIIFYNVLHHFCCF